MPVEPVNARRILIVRLSALGDLVHVLPLLDALRRARPDAQIGWLVEQGNASLLAAHPQLDQVLSFPRRELSSLLRRGRWLAAARLARSFLRELRAARFELTIDAQCNLRSSLLARLSGAKRRIGFAPPYTKEKAHWLPRSCERADRRAVKVERTWRCSAPPRHRRPRRRAQLAIPESQARGRAPRARGRSEWRAASGLRFGRHQQWARIDTRESRGGSRREGHALNRHRGRESAGGSAWSSSAGQRRLAPRRACGSWRS